MPKHSSIIKCRLVKEIGARVYLRVYWGGPCIDGYDRHDAMKHIKDIKCSRPWGHLGDPEEYPEESMWPNVCERCGQHVPPGNFMNQSHAFDGTPIYQVFGRNLYDTPEGILQPGDMRVEYGYHWDNMCLRGWTNCDGRHLVVLLPNGNEWDIDGRANNCTMPKDTTHRCWVRHGVAPAITVDKKGSTCAAGAGSILSGDYHGFLINGELRQI